MDDGIALLQAFASAELDIRGVSVVFGNADLATVTRIGKEIVGRFDPKSVTVFSGAGGASELGLETDASRALARALKTGRLMVLALGPATNVATVVRNHPELAANIEQVIAVAGRRPGQHFLSGSKQAVPFRDLNFELDPEAFRALLASRVPLVLAPWVLSAQVWLTGKDIRCAAAKNPGVAWMVPAANDWLALWREKFGTDGSSPFDALAIGYLVARQDLGCGALSAGIESGRNDTALSEPAAVKPLLVVRLLGAGKRVVTCCHGAKAGFHDDLVQRLQRTGR